jgi:hypothetical protein
MNNPILISPNDAAKITDLLELHICSNIVNEAPVEMKDRLQKEIQELNRIQKTIEEQLNVSGSGRM